MSTTTSNGTVMGACAITASLAEDCTDQLLQPRRIQLKHRKPRSSYVHQLRRDIACGKAKPIAMLLAITFADQDDGVPASLLVQPYLTIMAMIHARAEVKAAPAELPILPLVQRETRRQAEFDSATNALLDTQDSAAALDRVLEASAAYDDAQDQLVARVRARKARLQLTAGGSVHEQKARAAYARFDREGTL